MSQMEGRKKKERYEQEANDSTCEVCTSVLTCLLCCVCVCVQQTE